MPVSTACPEHAGVQRILPEALSSRVLYQVDRTAAGCGLATDQRTVEIHCARSGVLMLTSENVRDSAGLIAVVLFVLGVPWIDRLIDSIRAVEPATQVNELASRAAERAIRCVLSPGNGESLLADWAFVGWHAQSPPTLVAAQYSSTH